MNITMRKTKDLVPYDNNPRKNVAAIAAVAESIREFGFRNPILVDGDGVVVNGHTRLAAAKTLGIESVPVIVADDLTEAQIKALRIVDNKTAEIAGWDYEMLSAELEDLQSIDANLLGLTGFDIDDVLDDLVVADLEPISIEPEHDTVPKKQTTTLSFGKNRIPLTDEEAVRLAQAYASYVEVNRTNLGFVGFLLEQR